MNLSHTQQQLIHAEKMASLGQLTAGIAHEINNPINYISSSISGVQRNLKDILTVLKTYELITTNHLKEQITKVDNVKKEVEFELALEEMDELIQGIKLGTSKTKEIVNSLSTFSRLDEDALKNINLNENIDSTLALLKNQTQGRINIIKSYDHLPLVECFPGPINQVFMNILSNAIQAIKNKGTITIKTSPKTDDFYSKNTNQDEALTTLNFDAVVITITDTGIGMEEKIKKHIFDPFYTTKEIGQGTGLGLYISHKIIEEHSGSIQVKSQKGKGSTFSIMLPIKQSRSKFQKN